MHGDFRLENMIFHPVKVNDLFNIQHNKSLILAHKSLIIISWLYSALGYTKWILVLHFLSSHNHIN